MSYKFNKDTLIGKSPNSKEMRNYKNSLQSLSIIQAEASIGLILGDGSLQTQNKGKTYRIKFEWSQNSMSYINHVADLYKEWIISYPHKKVRISPKGNTIINYGFQTLSHEAFNFLAELFIKDGKKSVKKGLITNNLTPIGLAYWFMDDGGKLDYNPKSKNKNLVLNTQSFTSEEVIMMSEELNFKFDLDCEVRINKGKKIIVIKNYDNFIKLSLHYIIPSMRYKLPK